jgi:Icc-related predicted phosphoesterase
MDSAGLFRPHFRHLSEQADLLLLAGDLTRCGEAAEAAVMASELADLTVPKVAVLGNHDHHADQSPEVIEALEAAGVQVLEGTGTVVHIGGATLGVAGVKGFGGGFIGACASAFGEPEMKRFVEHTEDIARSLESALAGLRADRRVALLHYSPVEETLVGEHPGVYPFLGSYLLAEAVDRAGADLVVHGHAHRGSAKGATPGGVPVRNVAQPVLRRAYQVFNLSGRDERVLDPLAG